MIDVLKAFYSVHYNFGILAIIILLLAIFFLSKKIYIFAGITLLVVVAFNIAIYKMTDGKSWTLEAAVVKDQFGMEKKGDPMTFSVETQSTTGAGSTSSGKTSQKQTSSALFGVKTRVRR